MTDVAGLDDTTVRQLRVPCDWCGRMLVGKVRRSQVGQMVVVQEKHTDAAGRPCLGTGRALGSWPLQAELRMAGESYELRVGGGASRAFVSREAVVAALRELGVDRDAAQRLVASVEPGRPVVLEVSERRRQPRRTGGG